MVEVPAKRITVGLIVSWVLGVFIGIGALVGLFSNPLAGIFGLLAAAILLPPVNGLIARKLHFSISGGLKFLAVVGLLIAMGVTLGKGGSNDTTQNSTVSSTPVPAAQVLKVDTAAFVKEFDNNQLAAEEKYKDKTIQFTGKIANISQDVLSNYYLSIHPRNADQYYFGTSVQCFFKDKAALTSLSNGQAVTLQGKVDSQTLGIVVVKNCQVIP